MEGEVSLEESGGVLAAEDTQGLVEGFNGEIRVEAVEGGAEAGFEEDLVEGGALFVDGVGIEVFVVEDLVAQGSEPRQRNLFEIRFCDGLHTRRCLLFSNVHPPQLVKIVS
jgi:hypothetical protein